MFSISRRISMQWFLDEPSEPTNTTVLMASKSGAFVDVRFLKAPTGRATQADISPQDSELDWAFAGFKQSVGNNMTRFIHAIDSRTSDPASVIDQGTNVELPDGTISEKGSMINPETGRLTEYEEIWSDEPFETGMFLRRRDGTAWSARVGDVQISLGRDSNDHFWAWQAERRNGAWEVVYSSGISKEVCLIPEYDEDGWVLGKTVKWQEELWDVLEGAL